jgi:hypothetical protein
LCNGYWSVASTGDVEYYITSLSTVTFTDHIQTSQPSCSFGSEDCAYQTSSWILKQSLIWSSQSAETSILESISSRTKDLPSDSPEIKTWQELENSLISNLPQLPSLEWRPADIPGCSTPPPLNLDQCGHCGVLANKVELFYFPTSVVGGICGNRTTIVATPTGVGPNVLTINGTVFTSGSVYLKFQDVHAKSDPRPHGGTPCGPTISEVLVSVPTKDVSSEARREGPLRYDFGDLGNGPEPFSVWRHFYGYPCLTDSKISDTWCSRFTAPYEYEPNILWPTNILLTQIPLWSTCTPMGLIYDPPQALTTVEGLLSPTTTIDPPKQTYSSPASPGSQIRTPFASATAEPQIGKEEPGNGPQEGQHGDSSPAQGSNEPAKPQHGGNPTGEQDTKGPGNHPVPTSVHHSEDGRSSGNRYPSNGGSDPDPTTIQEFNPAFQSGSATGLARTTIAPGAIINVDNNPVTVISKDGYFVIGLQTLRPGSAIIMSGTVISANSQGLVVGGNTVSLSSLTMVSTGPSGLGVGDYVASGLGYYTSESTSQRKGQNLLLSFLLSVLMVWATEIL